MVKPSRLLKITVKCMEKCKEAGVRRYSHLFSPKKYTQIQHIVLLVLKEYLRTTYRGITDIMREFTRLCKLLKLRVIPHYTTLQKFLKKFQNCVLRDLVSAFTHSLSIVGVDATGFTEHYASKYYVRRVERVEQHPFFTKLSAAVDLEKQLIVGLKARSAPSHDNKDFLPLLRKIKTCDFVCADKAYDAEKNHEYIHLKLKAVAQIPVRKNVCKGFYRKKAMKHFDKRVYNQRSKSETVFSVLKKRFGDTLQSKTQWMRNKELSIKCLTYNLYRETLCYLIPFLQSPLKYHKCGYF